MDCDNQLDATAESATEQTSESIENIDIKTEPPDLNGEPEIITPSFSVHSIGSETNSSCDRIKLEEDFDIKQETGQDMFSPEVSICYDARPGNEPVPGVEDSVSSLQEELVLKEELEDINYEIEQNKEFLEEAEVKIENAHDMGEKFTELSITFEDADHEILNSQPMLDQMTELHAIDSDFQLNSITGNMLSLEQEAYGLLKTKNKSVNQFRLSCPKCPKLLRDKSGLTRHLKVHQTIENYENGVVKRKKTRELRKTLPPRKERKTKDDVKKPVFKCAICDKKYRTSRSLRRHQKTCVLDQPEIETVLRKTANVSDKKVIEKKKEGKYVCECGKIFNRLSPLQTCLRSHHPEEEVETFPCVTCAKQFNTKEDLARHRKIQHVKKNFHCKFCPMDYLTQKELFDHLKMHKKVQMMEYKVITEVVKGKVLKCFICRKTFAELSELKAHVLTDHKEPYSCSHCKEKFTTIVEFATHTKTSHPELEGQSVIDVLEAFSILAQAWKCEECHLQFEDPDNLVKHQREVHSPAKKLAEEDLSKFLFRCEDCRRMFATLKLLTTHRDIHHRIQDNASSSEGEETVDLPPPLPMCVHCRKVCKDEQTLTSHLRLHSPERKYACKFCDYRFSTVEKRKAHAQIHIGDMKFVCFACDYLCTSENRLSLHKQTQKHIDITQALLNGPPYERREPPPKKAKKRKHSECSEEVECDVCGEKFRNSKAMLEHKDTHPFIVFPNEDEPKRIFFK